MIAARHWAHGSEASGTEAFLHAGFVWVAAARATRDPSLLAGTVFGIGLIFFALASYALDSVKPGLSDTAGAILDPVRRGAGIVRLVCAAATCWAGHCPPQRLKHTVGGP